MIIECSTGDLWFSYDGSDPWIWVEAETSKKNIFDDEKKKYEFEGESWSLLSLVRDLYPIKCIDNSLPNTAQFSRQSNNPLTNHKIAIETAEELREQWEQIKKKWNKETEQHEDNKEKE